VGEVGAGRRQALVLARRELRGHRALALLVVLLVAAPVAAGTMLAVMERTAA
jgi:hypothetical protein